MLVAQAQPAMPQPKRKMNSWLSSALATVVTAVMSSVRRGRPVPLKNPSMAHRAAPLAAPPRRGNQKAPTRRSTSGSKPKGANSVWRAAPASTNKGSAHSVAQSAVQVAWLARR